MTKRTSNVSENTFECMEMRFLWVVRNIHAISGHVNVIYLRAMQDCGITGVENM